MTNTIAIIAPDDALLHDIAQQAVAAGLVTISNGRDIRYCPRDHIPAGWTRMGHSEVQTREAA